MDVSLELDVNYSDSRPTLRGSMDPTVSQASVVDISTLQYISKAIEDGDHLPNTEASLGAKTQRRALIVAPQYEVHFTKYQPLPATLNDIYNVHKMLTQRGYDRRNIRILVDGDGDTAPTRDNIVRLFQLSSRC
ncbi:hypothetical protein FRC08_013644 [Ceratobasidium sp. 394]|nr:hypothetical protein FRC08_013644 [Ceratobasidium sp. 394]